MEEWKLTAYVLGELEAAGRLEVERWIGTHRDRESEMRQLAIDLGRTERIVKTQKPVPLKPLVAPWERGNAVATGIKWALLAASVAGLVGLGWWLADRRTPADGPQPIRVASKPATPAAAATPPKKEPVVAATDPARPDVSANPSAPAGPTPAAAAVSAPVQKTGTTVVCLRDGKPVANAELQARVTYIPAHHSPMRTQLEKVTGKDLVLPPYPSGYQVLLRCQSPAGAQVELTHTIRAALETVYLPLPAEPKRTETALKKQRRLKEGQGKLSVKARPWAKCNVGGSPAKTTMFSMMLPSGTHRITCTKGASRKKKVVRIKAGQTHTVMFDFR